MTTTVATNGRYVNVKVNITQGQMEKIKKAVQGGTGVSIQLSHEDLSGEHVLALTRAQIDKMTKAYNNRTGVVLKLSKTQLVYNTKVEGGFLPALLGFLGSTVAPFLLKSALPALATGALSSIASAATSKALGSALYLKKGDHAVKIVPAGQGLYLTPWQKGSSVKASGLYIKTGKGFYRTALHQNKAALLRSEAKAKGQIAGEGLLLGPDSPFKNIPILGMIL